MVTVRDKVRFVETDMMGVAHHSNHFRWFEMARVEYLRKAGIDLLQLMEHGFLFPIWEVSCKYLASAKFDDYILIQATMTHLTRAQMEFTYQIFREKDGVLLAQGKTVNVFTTRKDGKVTRLPDVFYKKILAEYNHETQTVH